MIDNSSEPIAWVWVTGATWSGRSSTSVAWVGGGGGGGGATEELSELAATTSPSPVLCADASTARACAAGRSLLDCVWPDGLADRCTGWGSDVPAKSRTKAKSKTRRGSGACRMSTSAWPKSSKARTLTALPISPAFSASSGSSSSVASPELTPAPARKTSLSFRVVL